MLCVSLVRQVNMLVALGFAVAITAASTDCAEPRRLDGVRVGHMRAVLLEDGSQRQIETLSLRPLVFQIRDYLTAAECDELITAARPDISLQETHRSSSQFSRVHKRANVFAAARVDNASCPRLLQSLEERLSFVAGLPVATTIGRRFEPLNVHHYAIEGSFGTHHDHLTYAPRLLTALYYLSDVDGGGETVFPAANGTTVPRGLLGYDEEAICRSSASNGLSVSPRRGSALLWYNVDQVGEEDALAIHTGCRVRAGEKWSANHWLWTREIRTPEDVFW